MSKTVALLLGFVGGCIAWLLIQVWLWYRDEVRNHVDRSPISDDPPEGRF